MDLLIDNIDTLHVYSVRLFKGTAPLESPNAYGLDFSITNQSPVVILVDKDHTAQKLGAVEILKAKTSDNLSRWIFTIGTAHDDGHAQRSIGRTSPKGRLETVKQTIRGSPFSFYR
jgi:TFIIF-interacting CTD phosphatase-like protein